MTKGYIDKYTRFFGSENAFPVALLIGYCVLLFVQLNQPPLQRYPNWDMVWTDAMHAGKLAAVKDSLKVGELPAINPYQEFGWNNLGDTTSPQTAWFPPNLLILIMSPANVMIVKQLLLLMIAVLGAYFYLKRILVDRMLSFIGATMYGSLPVMITFLYTSILNTLCFIPLALLLIHELLEKAGRVQLLMWSLLSFMVIASGNIFLFFMMFPTITIYSFIVGRFFYRFDFKRILTRIFLMISLFFLASGVFILPLFGNIHQLSQSNKIISVLGVKFTPLTMRGFVDFINKYCAPTFFKPNDGSGVFMYIPIFFWIASFLVILTWPLIAKEKRKLIAVVVAYLLCALAMYFIGLVFYTIPELASLGHGVLRYQLNLVPFMGVLAGIVSFYCINNTSKLKIPLYILIAASSLVIDYFIMGVHRPDGEFHLFDMYHAPNLLFPSSNLFHVRFMDDMYIGLIVSNILILAGLFVYGIFADRISKKIASGYLIVMPLIILLNFSIQNELRATQQYEWQRVSRGSYHIDSYNALNDFLDKNIGPADPNYRILPASADVYHCGRGRNWKFQELLEMNVIDHRKVLFSYRETMHPFASFIYSRIYSFDGTTNWVPPVSDKIPGNISMLNLAGVKWVVSADTTIQHEDLVFRGKYTAAKCPFPETAADGDIYLYELRNPLSISFLVDKYEVMTATDSVSKIYNGKRPWIENTVYIDVNIPSNISGSPEAPPGKAVIIQETYNSIKLKVDTAKERFLVLSYVHRPGWKAYLENGEKLKIMRAYGGLMTTLIPAGEHTVSFHYVPKDVYSGLGISLLAFIVPFFV